MPALARLLVHCEAAGGLADLAEAGTFAVAGVGGVEDSEQAAVEGAESELPAERGPCGAGCDQG
jgi:hypothetical protein